MRARSILILTLVLALLGGGLPAGAAEAAKKKSKTPTAKQCTKKAIKKLKGKKKATRVKACKKRAAALKRKKRKAKAKPRPVAPAAPAPGLPAAPNVPGPPKDYVAQFDKLSKRSYETVKDSLHLDMADGTKIYIEVVRPKAEGKFGVILEASGYHDTLYNREGWRILPQPLKPDSDEPQGLTGYFAPRGYAVVMMDLRGTAQSSGCLDHLGPKDASDLKAVVEWAASQPWSNGKVGMVGHSYVGSTPSLAAAQNPKGLTTIVPSAGLASMYDHQYQAGVPWLLQWMGPVIGYQGLALARHLPPGTPQAIIDAAGWGSGGSYFGQNPQEAACGATQNAMVSGESMASGQYVQYHAERDFSEGAKNWNGNIFLIHGVNDEAARIASIYWFNQRGVRPGDKLWIGQWNHGIGCCPNRRGLQWTAALHAWFDKTLLGRDVDTGPPVELFLNDAATDVEAIELQTSVRTSKSWPVEGTKGLTFWTRTDETLGTEPGEDGTNTYQADGEAFTGGREATGAVDYVSEPLKEDILIAGPPTLELAMSQTVPRLHVTPTLIDESPEGTRRRISTCALQTQLREGLDRITPVIPAERMLVKPPCFTMAHHLKAGHKLVLKVASSDDDHVPTFANDPRVTVFSGKEGTRITVPTVPFANLYPDNIDLAAENYAGSGA